MDKIIKKNIDKFINLNQLEPLNYSINLTKEKKFGDYATNFCFLYAKLLNKTPEEVANLLKNYLLDNYHDFYAKIEFVKPGFLNFYLKNRINYDLIKKIIKEGFNYPIYQSNNKKINIEFVSANPTGKLHLAHAYAAIFGTALVNTFLQLGYDVQKEFYINDAGNQIDLLALSVLIRYLNLFNQNLELFEDSYHGEEIIECAEALKKQYGSDLINTKYNKEHILDEKINETIKEFAKNYMLKMIKDDLASINVSFDLWTSEKSLYETKQVQQVITDLKKANETYEKDGALWLQTTKYGDDKDRVLIKNNQLYTYLVPDIALHVAKLLRNYDEYYNIWGMDHHGYIARLKIALKMLGFKKTFDVICIQVMKLIKDNKDFKLSKRAGTSLTLQDLVNAIGKDELKWICTSYQTSSHKIVDVNKITQHDASNPLFYVEYASARINRIFQKNEFQVNQDFEYVDIDNEKIVNLVNELSLYDQTLHHVIKNKETQALNNYLYKLAISFHTFYSELNISNLKDQKQKQTLLHILYATWLIIHNGLKILGIKAYEEM